MTKRKKKVKEPFWKNLDPELRSIGAHIGKIFDNAKPSDIIDMIASLTAFYAGFNAGQLAKVDLKGSLGLGGSGVIALQLAKSPNIVAGASGTAFLASLGLINVWNPLTQAVSEIVEKIPPLKAPPPTFPFLPPSYLPPRVQIYP